VDLGSGQKQEFKKLTWLGSKWTVVDCLLAIFWTCKWSLFGMLSFKGVKVSLYCFSRDFTIALSMFATALQREKEQGPQTQGLLACMRTK